MKKRNVVCAHCGIKKKTTIDHIPPRCLFPRKIDGFELIKVPSCKPCHNKRSINDEYFRTFLSLDDDIREQEFSKFLWEKSSPALKRSKSLKKEVISRIRTASSSSSDNSKLIASVEYNFPQEPWEHVIEDIIKGLYFHIIKTPLVGHYECKVQWPTKIDEHSINSCAYKIEMGPYFQCIYNIAIDKPLASLWIMRFHGKRYATGYTCPLDEHGNEYQ